MNLFHIFDSAKTIFHYKTTKNSYFTLCLPLLIGYIYQIIKEMNDGVKGKHQRCRNISSYDIAAKLDQGG